MHFCGEISFQSFIICLNRFSLLSPSNPLMAILHSRLKVSPCVAVVSGFFFPFFSYPVEEFRRFRNFFLAFSILLHF
jgi:hypothetical protein